MKLVAFSVTNYRSITNAHKILLAGTTVLVGKNNEGKSNLLKALSVAMGEISNHSRQVDLRRRRLPIRHIRYGYPEGYSWERDFPISLQERKGKRRTVFNLEFELNNEDILSFKEEVGSNLNGTLPIEIAIGRDNDAEIRVVKRGKGSKTLNSRSGKITDFVAKRIFFNYIPAVRTHKETMEVIQEMVSQELYFLEEREEYQQAIKAISDLQEPVLRELADKIKIPLSEFLPNISGVDIIIDEDSRRVRHRRDFNVIINDGVATSIEYKGDGVKSLAALGLLKNRGRKGSVSVIAIEEPESHLHPAAIHQLKEVIASLEENNQVVISTHNPLFVNRELIEANVVVDGGKASQAKSISRIRDVLGVRVSDNLHNAKYVLVVEGGTDKKALSALLPSMSEKLGRALKSNILTIDDLGGASNLSYKLSLLESQLCSYYVLLDNDQAANRAKQAAFARRLLSDSQLTQTTCMGMSEAEFEDCILLECYKDAIQSEFGIDLSARCFRGNQKWALRMSETCSASGKVWDGELEKRIKTVVADCVVSKPEGALCPHKGQALRQLVTNLEGFVSDG